MDPSHQPGPNKKTRWIIKMNRRFEDDHERILAAFQKSMDFKNFSLAKKAFAACDYSVMNHHIGLMEKGCFDTTNYHTTTFTSEVEHQTKQTPTTSVIKAEEQCQEEFVDLSQFIIKHYDKSFDDESLVFKPKEIDSISEEDSDAPSEECSIPYDARDDLFSVTPSAKRRCGKFQGVPDVERRNVVTSNLTIQLVENMDESRFEHCDPAVCTDCVALSYPDLLKISSNCVVIYSGPGAGKTECIKDLRRTFGRKITIRDTDHLKSTDVVPKNSVLFTNRADVLMSYDGAKIAFLPYRRHWIDQCSSKCAGTLDSWYDDVVNLLNGCILVRRNCYLSECISFAM